MMTSAITTIRIVATDVERSLISQRIPVHAVERRWTEVKSEMMFIAVILFAFTFIFSFAFGFVCGFGCGHKKGMKFMKEIDDLIIEEIGETIYAKEEES